MKKIFQNINNKGFSLIELMLSTVILLMLATLIIPNPKVKITIDKEARLIEILDKTRGALIKYKNDYGYFPRIGETASHINYLYRLQFGSGLPENQVDVLIPKKCNNLALILENTLLEPAIPINKMDYLMTNQDGIFDMFKPPYLRGDGSTRSEINFSPGDNEPRGFYLNPISGIKYDWEVFIVREDWPYDTSNTDNKNVSSISNINSTTDTPYSGWYKLSTKLFKWSDPSPSDPLINSGIITLGTDFQTSHYNFPPDFNVNDDISQSCEITNIRFSPAGDLGEKGYYKAVNSEYGIYYYQW